MKTLIIILVLFFSCNVLAKTEMEFEMSNLIPESNSGVMQAEYVIQKQKSDDEKFAENNEEKVKQILSSGVLKEALLLNLHYFNKEAQRKEFFLGYLQLGGVDFDLMYRIFMQKQKDLDYAFNKLQQKENELVCQMIICSINIFYNSGIDWGKYSMINFWFQSLDLKKKREDFISKDNRKLSFNYINDKNNATFLKKLYSKISYEGYKCNDEKQCFIHITDIDIYSKLILLCNNELMNKNEMKLFNVDSLLFQDCLFKSIKNDYIIKRQFFYEGFFEGYTKYLKIYPERRF